MHIPLTTPTLFVPISIAAAMSMIAEAISDTPSWEKLIEKWGIAAVMAYLLWWAVKKIDASDKSRIELSQQMLANQEVLHGKLEHLLNESIESRNNATTALNELSAELKKRPCGMTREIVHLTRKFRDTTKIPQ